MFEHVFAIAISLYLVKVLAIVFLYRKLSFWRAQGKLLSENSGHLTPEQPAIARLLLAVVATVFCRLKIGKVKVYGAERLRGSSGGYRLIITPNHQNELDSLLMACLLRKRKYRFLIAMDQVQGARAPLMAFIGAIPVIRENPRLAVTALKAAVDGLCRESGSDFLIFPQGKLVASNELLESDYHNGAVQLGKKAESLTKEPFALLPVFIDYLNSPKEAGPLARALMVLRYDRSFFGTTVYGATVRVGEPIPIAHLPENATESTKLLLQATQSLSEQPAPK